MGDFSRALPSVDPEEAHLLVDLQNSYDEIPSDDGEAEDPQVPSPLLRYYNFSKACRGLRTCVIECLNGHKWCNCSVPKPSNRICPECGARLDLRLFLRTRARRTEAFKCATELFWTQVSRDFTDNLRRMRDDPDAAVSTNNTIRESPDTSDAEWSHQESIETDDDDESEDLEEELALLKEDALKDVVIKMDSPDCEASGSDVNEKQQFHMTFENAVNSLEQKMLAACKEEHALHEKFEQKMWGLLAKLEALQKEAKTISNQQSDADDDIRQIKLESLEAELDALITGHRMKGKFASDQEKAEDLGQKKNEGVVSPIVPHGENLSSTKSQFDIFSQDMSVVICKKDFFRGCLRSKDTSRRRPVDAMMGFRDKILHQRHLPPLSQMSKLQLKTRMKQKELNPIIRTDNLQDSNDPYLPCIKGSLENSRLFFSSNPGSYRLPKPCFKQVVPKRPTLP